MTRRPKGAGSIKERPGGKYQGYVPYRDALSRPRKKYFTSTTKRAVQKAMSAFQRTLSDRANYDPSTQPLHDYMAAWLDPEDGDAIRHVRPHVLRSYEFQARVYIIPRLGHIALGELTTAHVQAMLDDIEACKLSPGTGQRAKSVLQSALQDAVRRGAVMLNVARGTRASSHRREEMKYWRPSETRTFLDAVTGHEMEAYYLLALTLGLRMSEALGLRWQDVDLAECSLSVRQALQNGPVTTPLITEVKSKAARRTVRLSQAAVVALRARHEHQQVAEMLAHQEGREWHNERLDFVFTTASGYPYNQHNIRRQFHALSLAAGVPRIRVHDMRHTAATLMVASGVPIHIVSKTLGHSSIRVTLDIYGHLYDEQKQEVADAMDRLLAKPAAKPPDELPDELPHYNRDIVSY